MFMFMFMFIFMFMLWHVHVLRYYSPSQRKYSASSPLYHGPTQRTRYFERATMLVKYAVLRLFIVVKLIPTKEMIADIFTKAVEKDTFILMRKHLLNLGGDVANQVVHGRATRMARKLADLIGLL
jgi:hypothetical protein